MFKTVVFPYDFSSFSESVVPYVKKMKDAGTETVVIVSVIEYESFVPRPVSKELELREYKEKNKERLEYVKKEIESEGLAVKIIVDYGVASKVISKVALDVNADLILMGSLGTGFSHSLLGSTVQNVLKISQVPVLIVPAH